MEYRPAGTGPVSCRAVVRAAVLAAMVLLTVVGCAGSEPEADSVLSAVESRTLSAQPGQGNPITTADTVTLTLLHNNDGESKLLPDPDGGFPGIARFTQTLQDLGTATDADILLRVTSGDNFLASPELSVGLARTGEPLYDSIALSGLYEAMGLGNHDFDFGPEVTARFIEGFSPAVPFLAANLDVGDEPALQALADEGRIAGSAVFADPVSGLEIGIVGAITPRLANISSPRNVVVDPDVAAAVNAEVEGLLAQGVSRIVLVSHLQGLSEDQALVPQLRGVDIVVAGGGDELLRNADDSCLPDEPPVGPYPLVVSDADGVAVPIVTTPGGYRCVGRLDVTFDADGAIAEYEGTSVGVPLDGAAEQYAVDNVETPLTEALAALDANVVATSDVRLDGRRNSVRTAPTNLGELLADALLDAGQRAGDFGGSAATVAVQNGGGIRNDSVIPPGDITEGDTFDVAPFANFVVTVEVPRERFKELLEVAVAALPEPGGPFPQIAGFSMTVDPTEPAREVDTAGDCSATGADGSRIREITLDDGEVIVADGEVVAGPPVVLATIDFLANGGDCYPLGDLDSTAIATSYQQALGDFVTGPLAGEILGADYPAGGQRITFIEGAASGSAGSSAAPSDSAGDGSSGNDDGGDAAATDDGGDTLPNTGLDSWLYLITAVAVLCGGALIAVEARRAGKLSLGNRLAATQAWFPDDDVNMRA